MIYPWLYLFLCLAAGITINLYTNLNFPVYVVVFMLVLTVLIPSGVVSYLTLGLASFLLGVNVSYKEVVNIEPQTAFVECISLSTNSYSFNCKVINSDVSLIKGRNIKVYSDNKDIFLFSRVAFIGRVESYADGIRAFPTKEFIKIDNGDNPLYFIKSIKDRLIENYRHKALNGDTFNLGLGLIFGERSNISQSDYRSFVKSGLAHLLAISGSHIAILMVVLSFTLFFIPTTIRHLFMMVFIPVYTLFTGLAIPTVRASLMAVLFYISKLKYFKFNSLNVLFLVGCLYLVLFPDSLFSASFQLSFVAVFGIIVGLEMFKNHPIMVKVLALSFMATLFTAPVVMYHFGNVSLNSIISTPLASLPLYPYLFFAFINVFTGFSIEPVVRFMDGFGYLFLVMVKLFENAPFYFIGFRPNILSVAIFYIGLILIIFFRADLTKKVIAMLLMFTIFSMISKAEPKRLTVFSFQGKDYPTLFIVINSNCYLVADHPVYRQLAIFDRENCQQRFLITQKVERFTDDYLSMFDKVYHYQYQVMTEDFTLKRWLEYRLYRNGKEYLIKNQNGEVNFE